ncbi:armadillo repeat-containing protein 1-like [Nilaparvata lugens]|uniref:armadillo repeat-containing protein 1-like n=1 Tax=Nilaparvata lugens TaxID=108931 RepID=UPI000B9908C2|nr:armadillo repeat-containing protein 1-like [Nilaparvata lugens]
MVDDNANTVLQTVSRYKTLSQNVENHPALIKDDTMIQFLAYSLSSPDLQVISETLETFYNLMNHGRNQQTLRSVFGVAEAIKAVSERDDLSDELKGNANNLHEMITSNTYTPMRGTLETSKSTPMRRKISTKVTTFQVQGLSVDTRQDLECAVVKVKGVVSVVVDVESQRCVVRALSSVTPQLVAETIADRTDMVPRLVLRNKNNQEYLQNILDEDDETDSLPPYLEEEYEPPIIEKNAVSTFDAIRTNASGWLNAATTFLQSSFYW